MPLGDRLIRVASRHQLPQRTLRLRLTLLYGGLFLVCGAALLAITYVLVAHATWRPGSVRSVFGGGVRVGLPHGHHLLSANRRVRSGYTVVARVARGQRISDLHQLVIWSGIALAGMSLASIALGWIVAGRALRPLRTITATTREISATNLHRRLALEGTQDDVKDLADTIDALLARLEGAFQAQRAFVANASHELRTPLALSRAMLQFALADPELSLESLKATCEEALDAGADHEQLLEALLTLSRSQQELERREPIELAATVKDVLGVHRQPTTTYEVDLGAATISGDPALVRRLVSNLVENAVRYNIPGGHVRVALRSGIQSATLTVDNTGPVVRADQIPRLLQPFRRLGPDRATDGHGHGLGLSIVAAVASAHNARLDIQPNPGGGLHIGVTFPAVQPPLTGTRSSCQADRVRA